MRKGVRKDVEYLGASIKGMLQGASDTRAILLEDCPSYNSSSFSAALVEEREALEVRLRNLGIIFPNATALTRVIVWRVKPVAFYSFGA